MSHPLRLPLPVWNLQYQLLGGHRRMILIVVTTTAVLAITILGIYRVSQRPFSQVAGWVLYFLTGLQAFVTVLAGCNAVYRAMLRDYENRMMESHRLTPMSNLTIVLGYLFGSTLQTLALFCVFTATGAVVSQIGGHPVDQWLFGNLLLLNGTVMLWAAVVFLGMRPQKPISPAPIVVGFAALSAPLAAVPVLGLITGVYSGYLGIWMMVGTVKVPPIATMVVAAVSVVYTVFWISTAAVKYRRPDLPAIQGVRGLVLLTLSLLIGAIGIVAFEHITTSSKALEEFYKRSLALVQWIATMTSALLLAAVVTAGTVKCTVLGSRGTVLRGRSDQMSPLTVAILSAVLICVVMAAVGATIWSRFLPAIESRIPRDNLALYARYWAWTGAACLIPILSFRSLFEIGYRFMTTPKVLVIIFLLSTWGLPPMIDSIRMQYVREFHGSADYSWLMGCCPPGMLVAIWTPLSIRLWPGLAAQLGVLLVLVLIARRARRRDGSVREGM